MGLSTERVGVRKRRRPAIALKASLLAVLVLGILLGTAVLYFGARHGFSIQAIEDLIRSWGPWGGMASIGLMILHSLVPFPAEFLALANGMVYGPVWGTVVTWTGAMLGAYLAFGLARLLGRPFVEMMVSRKRWDFFDEWTADHAGRLVLISRFVPVIAFNLINYAAGLTGISWWTFTWATGIGILPMSVLMVVMGDQIDSLEWWLWLPIMIIFFRFLDVSSGFEDVGQRGREQVDDGDEGGGISIAARA